MNILSFEKQIEAIAALTEGCSIRATERLTDIHRDTIMRLGVRVGEGCANLHDRMMRGLQVPILEFDEIWAYVGKKQRRTGLGEKDKGDQYTFVALDATSKAIIWALRWTTDSHTRGVGGANLYGLSRVDRGGLPVFSTAFCFRGFFFFNLHQQPRRVADGRSLEKL